MRRYAFVGYILLGIYLVLVGLNLLNLIAMSGIIALIAGICALVAGIIFLINR